MQHAIDPKVDCVFKALLGAETNSALLIHFLNAILETDLSAPITAVEILNPYNEREFINDKLSIVDVKARDTHGHLYQVEIQLLTHRDLLARMIYAWADFYSGQLQSGNNYSQLKPTYSIWLLNENVLRNIPEYAHNLRLRDAQGRCFLDHGGIWLLELNKFQIERIENEQQRWLKFFKEGEQLDTEQLPSWMHTNEMEQAMNTLKTFSEKDRAYHAYQARQNYLRVQSCIQLDIEENRVALEQTRVALEQERAAKEQERAAKEQAQLTAEQERTSADQARLVAERERAAKEAALLEIAQLKAQLQDHGNSIK